MSQDGKECILEVKGITKQFPGVTALNNVSMHFTSGEVHALVGENGAGKSTLMKILSGVYMPTSGEIFLKGEPYHAKNPFEAQQAGISIIFQEFSLIRNFTVVENVFLNREPSNHVGFMSAAKVKGKMRELLDEMNVELDIQAVVGKLTVVEQQVVEIIKALSIDARILIMDEPTSSLTDVEIKKLFDIIQYLRKKGVAIIYISHMLDEVFQIADCVTVLKDGEVMGTKGIKEIDKTELVSMMVGRKIEDYFPDFHKERGDVLLEVKGLELEGKLSGIDFSIRAGEVLGIAGLMGSGRAELIDCILGLQQQTGGEILMHGKQVGFTGIRDAMAHGIGYISEDRKNEGILGPLSVLENITIANLDAYTNAGVINRRAELKDGRAQVELLKIKVSSASQLMEELSGGNQQKALISRWLLRRPKLYIFSEPTRGIDVGAKVDIYRIIRDLTKQGNSVIIVSSELPEVLGMADRIMVMRSGQVGGIVDQGDRKVSEEEIMSLAVGHEFSIAEQES